MKAYAICLMNDEGGMIVSAELAIVLTVSVLAMVVGLNGITGAITGELNDISSAFGAIDQSYTYHGLAKFGHSWAAGSGYVDARDFCDCTAIWSTGAARKHHGGAAYGMGTIVAPHGGPALPAPCPTGDCPPDVEAPCDNCEPTDDPMEATPEPTEEAPAPEAAR